MRVTAELIDAEVGNHIWTEQFDRDISEVFSIQDETTEAIVNAIIPAVSDTEQRRALVRPEAFTQYVRRRPPWFLAANHEHMLDGLRKAGWDS